MPNRDFSGILILGPSLTEWLQQQGFGGSAEHISKFYPKGEKKIPSRNQHRQIKMYTA